MGQIMRSPALLQMRMATLWAALVVLAVFMGAPPALYTQEGGNPEYSFKAVYLYDIIQFAEFPDSVFPEPDSPFVVGVLGRDPFGPLLDRTMENEKVENHEISVKRFSDVSDARNCQILFITKSMRDSLSVILQRVRRRPVLTVSDIDGFAQAGGAVGFYVENNKLRFEINTDALKHAGITLSSKLLRLAHVMPKNND